jgi:hypothetical protein
MATMVKAASDFRITPENLEDNRYGMIEMMKDLRERRLDLSAEDPLHGSLHLPLHRQDIEIHIYIYLM